MHTSDKQITLEVISINFSTNAYRQTIAFDTGVLRPVYCELVSKSPGKRDALKEVKRKVQIYSELMSESLNLVVRRKMMDMFARRNHSEDEIRQKLRTKFHAEEDIEAAIEDAIQYAKKNRWLGDPSDLSQDLADTLHRKNKGAEYINNVLKEKGLPTIQADHQQELEKAKLLVREKFSDADNIARDDKPRVARFLASRGFDEEIIRTIVFDEGDL